MKDFDGIKLHGATIKNKMKIVLSWVRMVQSKTGNSHVLGVLISI